MTLETIHSPERESGSPVDKGIISLYPYFIGLLESAIEILSNQRCCISVERFIEQVTRPGRDVLDLSNSP